MAPLNPISSWQERGVIENRTPAKKYFFVCEGLNTERLYFEALFVHLDKMGLPLIADLVYVERTDEIANESNPVKLKEHADLVCQDLNGDYGFEEQTDKIIIVFDADIYKKKPLVFLDLLTDIRESNFIAAVTQPSIEIFLLLHRENAYADLIKPYEKELLENKKDGRRRFIDKHFSNAYGKRSKKKKGSIGDLAAQYEIAIAEERHLNNDIERSCECLTSNIGQIIFDLISEGKNSNK